MTDKPQQQVTDETVVMTPESTNTPEVVSDGEQPPIAPPLDPAYENRRQRIFDHRAGAQAVTNPLTACLAGVNSDLLDCELHIGEALRHAMATSGMSIDDIERHSRPIDLLVRLAKQVAQITQLELRTRKDGADSAATNSQERTEAKKTPGCAPTEIADQVV